MRHDGSDGTKQPCSRPFLAAGTGMIGMQFRCGACDRPSSSAGSTIRRVRGARLKVCAACKERIDARAASCG